MTYLFLSTWFFQGLRSESKFSYLPNQVTSSRRKTTSSQPPTLTCSDPEQSQLNGLPNHEKPVGQQTQPTGAHPASSNTSSPRPTSSECKCLNCHFKLAQHGDYFCRMHRVFGLMPTLISCCHVDPSRAVGEGVLGTLSSAREREVGQEI